MVTSLMHWPAAKSLSVHGGGGGGSMSLATPLSWSASWSAHTALIIRRWSQLVLGGESSQSWRNLLRLCRMGQRAQPLQPPHQVKRQRAVRDSESLSIFQGA